MIHWSVDCGDRIDRDGRERDVTIDVERPPEEATQTSRRCATAVDLA